MMRHPTHIQGVKLGSVQPPSQQPDLESELIATNIALSNVLSKIEMGDLPYESMAEMDVMEHPDVATALSLVKRWNFLQESFQSSISSPNQIKIFEDVVYNIASIEVLLGYLLYHINHNTAALAKLEKSCPVLWRQKRSWKESLYDGWINCFAIIGELYSNQQKIEDLHRLEKQLIETVSGIERLFPPSATISVVQHFIQLSNDELRILTQEMKGAWMAAESVRSRSKSAIIEILHGKTNQIRATAIAKAEKSFAEIVDRFDAKVYTLQGRTRLLTASDSSDRISYDSHFVHEALKRLICDEINSFLDQMKYVAENSVDSTVSGMVIDSDSKKKPSLSPTPTAVLSPTSTSFLTPTVEYHYEEDEYKAILLQQAVEQLTASSKDTPQNKQKMNQVKRQHAIPARSPVPPQSHLGTPIGFHSISEVKMIVDSIIRTEKRSPTYIPTVLYQRDSQSSKQGRQTTQSSKVQPEAPTVLKNESILMHHLQQWQNLLLGVLTFIFCYFGSRYLVTRTSTRSSRAGATSLKSSYFSGQHQTSRPRQRLQQHSTPVMTSGNQSAKSRKQIVEELLLEEKLEKEKEKTKLSNHLKKNKREKARELAKGTKALPPTPIVHQHPLKSGISVDTIDVPIKSTVTPSIAQRVKVPITNTETIVPVSAIIVAPDDFLKPVDSSNCQISNYPLESASNKEDVGERDDHDSEMSSLTTSCTEDFTDIAPPVLTPSSPQHNVVDKRRIKHKIDQSIIDDVVVKKGLEMKLIEITSIIEPFDAPKISEKCEGISEDNLTEPAILNTDEVLSDQLVTISGSSTSTKPLEAVNCISDCAVMSGIPQTEGNRLSSTNDAVEDGTSKIQVLNSQLQYYYHTENQQYPYAQQHIPFYSSPTLVSIPPPPPTLPAYVSQSNGYPGSYPSHMIVPMGHPIMSYPPTTHQSYGSESGDVDPVPAMMPVLIVPLSGHPSTLIPPFGAPTGANSTPNPISFGTFDVDEQIAKDCAIVNQIEYYFSIENLQRDHYLRKLMDDEGFVVLKEVLKFRRIANMRASLEEILLALQQSQQVVLSFDENINEWKIRPTEHSSTWPLK